MEAACVGGPAFALEQKKQTNKPTQKKKKNRIKSHHDNQPTGTLGW
uniref:Uncharacterized protein n=1 Tax=Nelumbo nucifera TaxID=4432 RepID=A0A822XTB7_NELNU|nr:TPA_asm: hypothetical protein HUJ06_023792 [Nelumbo nucifera]